MGDFLCKRFDSKKIIKKLFIFLSSISSSIKFNVNIKKNYAILNSQKSTPKCSLELHKMVIFFLQKICTRTHECQQHCATGILIKSAQREYKK